MNVQDPHVVEFLEMVRKDCGDKVHAECQTLIEKLPDAGEFRPFAVLTEARYRLMEEDLHKLAAMNATPFGSYG